MEQQCTSAHETLEVLEYGEPPDPPDLSGRVELLVVSVLAVDAFGLLLTLLLRWLVYSTWTEAAATGFGVVIFFALQLAVYGYAGRRRRR